MPRLRDVDVIGTRSIRCFPQHTITNNVKSVWLQISSVTLLSLSLCRFSVKSYHGTSPPRAVKSIQIGSKRKPTYPLGRKYNQRLLVSFRSYKIKYNHILNGPEVSFNSHATFLFRFVVQTTAGQSRCTHHHRRHTERPLVYSWQVSVSGQKIIS